MKSAGQDPWKAEAFNVVATVTLCSDPKASLLWIILWLVSGSGDHGMILWVTGCPLLGHRRESAICAVNLVSCHIGISRSRVRCASPGHEPDSSDLGL